jgi:hypothetical protein
MTLLFGVGSTQTILNTAELYQRGHSSVVKSTHRQKQSNASVDSFNVYGYDLKSLDLFYHRMAYETLCGYFSRILFKSALHIQRIPIFTGHREILEGKAVPNLKKKLSWDLRLGNPKSKPIVIRQTILVVSQIHNGHTDLINLLFIAF